MYKDIFYIYVLIIHSIEIKLVYFLHTQKQPVVLLLTILFCSVAILRYICRTYNVADHWYPKDSAKQARVDEYLEWQHLNTRANCALYYLHKVCFNKKQ